MEKIYITTAIPYVNGVPHIGHAMDYCLADTYARYERLIGNEVKFQAGTDEHGNKMVERSRAREFVIAAGFDKCSLKTEFQGLYGLYVSEK